jgi:hypothetical protein
MTVQEKLDTLKKEMSNKFEQFIFAKDKLKYFKSQREMEINTAYSIAKIAFDKAGDDYENFKSLVGHKKLDLKSEIIF